MDSPTRIPRHKASASTGGHSRISSVTSLMADDGTPGLRTLSRSSTARTNLTAYSYSASPPPVQDLGQRVLVHWDRGIDISSAGQHIMAVLRKLWGAEQQLLIKQTTLDSRRKKTASSLSTSPSSSSPSSSAVNVLLVQATNEVSKWEEILRRYELELDGLVFKRFQLVRVKAQAGKHVPQGAGRVYIKAPGFSLPKAEVKRIRGGAGKTEQTSTQQVRPTAGFQGEENEGSIGHGELTDSACELGSDSHSGHESDQEREKEILGDGYEDIDGTDDISADDNVITPQGTCIICNMELPQHILPERQQNAVIQLNELEIDSEQADHNPMMCLLCLSKLWDRYGTVASNVAAARLELE